MKPKKSQRRRVDNAIIHTVGLAGDFHSPVLHIRLAPCYEEEKTVTITMSVHQWDRLKHLGAEACQQAADRISLHWQSYAKHGTNPPQPKS